jgi:hypothetical protein
MSEWWGLLRWTLKLLAVLGLCYLIFLMETEVNLDLPPTFVYFGKVGVNVLLVITVPILLIVIGYGYWVRRRGGVEDAHGISAMQDKLASSVEPGTKVDILTLDGGAHGTIVGKPRKERHIWWYEVEVVNGGTSRFQPGDTLECRSHWLARRHDD